MGTDKNNTPLQQCMKDMVCIHTDKVFDVCKDKECLENLRVYFGCSDQAIINRATSVKFKKAEVLWVSSDVEPVPFNRGYYSVDICFFFKIRLEVNCGMNSGTYVDGLATYNKKIILFGSEGNAHVFESYYRPGAEDIAKPRRRNMPKAVVEIVDPMALGVKLAECSCDCKCDCDCGCDDSCCVPVSDIPCSISELFDGGLFTGEDGNRVYVTIGIFVIVRLQRSVQLLVPCNDYCLPDKECTASADDDPCTIFEKINFPFDEFYPPFGGCDNSHGKRC